VFCFLFDFSKKSERERQTERIGEETF
jgi:hypothetical protein